MITDPRKLDERMQRLSDSMPSRLPLGLVYAWRRSPDMFRSYDALRRAIEAEIGSGGTGAPGSARRLIAVYGDDLAVLLDQWLPLQPRREPRDEAPCWKTSRPVVHERPGEILKLAEKRRYIRLVREHRDTWKSLARMGIV